MKSKVLVTGGQGYLGICLTDFFQAASLSRRGGGDLLAADVSAYDTIIHCAAVIDKSGGQGTLCQRANLALAARIAGLAQPHQTVIYTSTKDVYGIHAERFQTVPETCPTAYQGQSPYAWSKRLGEDILLAAATQKGFRLGIFRLATVFAPATPDNPGGWVSKFAAQLRKGGELHLRWSGQQVRDILPVGELGRACQAFIASGRQFGLYNVGGGLKNSGTLKEFALMLAEIHRIPSALVQTRPDPVPGDQFRYISDLTRLRQELDWEPTFDLGGALAMV
ncbi:MAG: NAD(P)-dependent oxidoreductase [Blastocatellia bacterium]|nr:NAD(P)-dependent oxidoreductase [Blastocatellia bacterium]